MFLLKCTGVFVIYFLFLKSYNVTNVHESHWAYLWSPVYLKDKWYWRVYMKRQYVCHGSIEHGYCAWEYDLETATKVLPSGESCGN